MTHIHSDIINDLKGIDIASCVTPIGLIIEGINYTVVYTGITGNSISVYDSNYDLVDLCKCGYGRLHDYYKTEIAPKLLNYDLAIDKDTFRFVKKKSTLNFNNYENSRN